MLLSVYWRRRALVRKERQEREWFIERGLGSGMSCVSSGVQIAESRERGLGSGMSCVRSGVQIAESRERSLGSGMACVSSGRQRAGSTERGLGSGMACVSSGRRRERVRQWHGMRYFRKAGGNSAQAREGFEGQAYERVSQCYDML